MDEEYQFIENTDPKNSLDFDSELTYHYLTGQTNNLNKQVSDNLPYNDGKQIQDEYKQQIKHKKNNGSQFGKIVLVFIMVFVLALFWYFLKRPHHRHDRLHIDNYFDHSDIELFSISH